VGAAPRTETRMKMIAAGLSAIGPGAVHVVSLPAVPLMVQPSAVGAPPSLKFPALATSSTRTLPPAGMSLRMRTVRSRATSAPGCQRGYLRDKSGGRDAVDRRPSEDRPRPGPDAGQGGCLSGQQGGARRPACARVALVTLVALRPLRAGLAPRDRRFARVAAVGRRIDQTQLAVRDL
jgi:hypothetical protein